MTTAAEPSPLQLLRDALPTLTGARLRVAEVVLADPLEAGRKSITWLATRAETQPATVTRLSSSLGYSGFPAFRAAIASESGRELQAGWASDIGTDVAPDDPPETIMNVLAGHQFRALRSALANVDLARIARAADLIASADRVEIFGEWGDHPPADELQMRLMRLGVPVWMHDGAYGARVGASLLGPEGVAIAISRNGDSEIAQAFLAEAAAHGATTIAITGAPDGAVGAASDIVLFTGTGGGRTWTEYFAGRASDGFVGGVLWMLVAQRRGASFMLPG
ncbi:MurR/RpiR family transcriptional regulator [Leifsonia shinshuensis]|uniref:MurR/RpiR family transcriptional regulator n=1 Tax=Leifsonia shinshuensis TaxID=150026 RepID=UPI002859FA87|nr:MurR/RpiR family transcriptional regulator [Leifsonia shinshuensis]MDR6972687.1 DNA-binding MurR/RpiR family transcriptional regulator [Leifsonia shinshuensis]